MDQSSGRRSRQGQGDVAAVPLAGQGVQHQLPRRPVGEVELERDHLGLRGVHLIHLDAHKRPVLQRAHDPNKSLQVGRLVLVDLGHKMQCEEAIAV